MHMRMHAYANNQHIFTTIDIVYTELIYVLYHNYYRINAKYYCIDLIR